MLVSILIPCFNAERWIKECIQSALEQDYPHKEVIVLDDGSTDGSLEAIRVFGSQVEILPGPHRGANAARNQLTGRARGEWVQYLDADDYLLQGKLSSQMHLLQERRGALDVIYCPVICQDVHRPGDDYVNRIRHNDEVLDYIQWGAIQTTGMLFRREAVLEIGGWKEDQPCCQEHELLLRLMLAGSRIAAGNQPRSVYRFCDSGSVSRKDPARVVRTRMELTDRLACHLESAGRLAPQHRKALFIARMEAARSLFSIDPELAVHIWSKAVSLGRSWTLSSPALRLHYQIGLRFLGFRRAERLAEWLRS